VNSNRKRSIGLQYSEFEKVKDHGNLFYQWSVSNGKSSMAFQTVDFGEFA
jgi:hypothetical protein